MLAILGSLVVQHILLNAFPNIPVGHTYLGIEVRGGTMPRAINDVAYIAVESVFSNCIYDVLFFHIHDSLCYYILTVHCFTYALRPSMVFPPESRLKSGARAILLGYGHYLLVESPAELRLFLTYYLHNE